MDLTRIVEYQASLASYNATQNEIRAAQLEFLIELTKPKNKFTDWHPLIATPFRYSPPHPEARFRPPYGKNVFYGSCCDETALYEHAFHFMKQRVHLNIKTETGLRTLFAVVANDKKSYHIKNENTFSYLINRNDYVASQQFVKNHPHYDFILYPSCRDPKARDNAAIMNIHYLNKKTKMEQSIKFFYDNQLQQIIWIDQQLRIAWKEVK